MNASRSGDPPQSLDDVQQTRQVTPVRPASVPHGVRRRKDRKEQRDLKSVSCVQHFLEQKMRLPGVLPAETFTPLGAWPVKGATKPDNIDELLYNGVSHCHEGRHAYLKARALIPPQKKNKTPATSNQEVAWEYFRGKPSKILPPVRSSAAACVAPC